MITHIISLHLLTQLLPAEITLHFGGKVVSTFYQYSSLPSIFSVPENWKKSLKHHNFAIMNHTVIGLNHNVKKAPQGGWRLSPPACTACCSLPAITIISFWRRPARRKNAVHSGDVNISGNSKSCDHQLREKFRNLAPISCRLGPILSQSCISC